MLHRFTKKQFEVITSSNFDSLDFYPGAIYYHGKKLSRLALVDFCSMLYNQLQAHFSVVNGAMRLSPACSWSSLTYHDLSALVCVLLTDYIWLYRLHASHVVDAYIKALPSSPFASFLSISKTDVIVPVQVYTYYVYDDKKFKCVSDLWDYVHEKYPESKFNVSLKF